VSVINPRSSRASGDFDFIYARGHSKAIIHAGDC
jgi:hypothetical protein